MFPESLVPALYSACVVDSVSERREACTSGRMTAGTHPPSQDRCLVHASSHENGVVSTTVPPGLTIRGSAFKNFLGSGSRHIKFAASTASTGARFDARLQASPTLNSTCDGSESVGMCASLVSCMHATAAHLELHTAGLVQQYCQHLAQYCILLTAGFMSGRVPFHSMGCCDASR
jgi:hypothetical protein